MSRKLKDVELVSDQKLEERLSGLSADEIDGGFEESLVLVEDSAAEIITRKLRTIRAKR